MRLRITFWIFLYAGVFPFLLFRIVIPYFERYRETPPTRLSCKIVIARISICYIAQLA
jgi:hypothetical protein